MTYESVDEIYSLVKDTLVKCGLGNICPILQISFNPKLKAVLGEANYSKSSITFASQMWPRASDSERKEVIIHEALHIVADHYLGPTTKPHGKGWAFLMDRFGFPEARTCHRVLPVNRHRVSCGCGVGTRTNSYLARISKGQHEGCSRCKQPVLLLARAPAGEIRV